MISFECPSCEAELKKVLEYCPHCNEPTPPVLKEILSKEYPNYIIAHWRGQLSLTQAFWINLVVVNIAIWAIDFSLFSQIRHPKVLAWVTIFFYSFILFIVNPWQAIGLWRTCNRRKNERWRGAILATLVQALIIVGVISAIREIPEFWKGYKALYGLAF